MNKASHNFFGESVRWDLSQIRTSTLPFSFFECEMSAFGISSRGYGTAWDRSDAAAKSFSEAWERMWFELKKTSLAITSTNGFAAGISDQIAKIRSRSELLERTILLEAWETKSGWELSSNYSLRSVPLLLALKLKGWQIRFFKLKSNLGCAKVCLAKHEEFGALFDSSFLGTRDESLVDKNLALSIAKNVILPRSVSMGELPVHGQPRDHLRFYARCENLAAFKFLDDLPQIARPLQIEYLDSIENQILSSGSELPSVCFSKNKNWKPLTWGARSIAGNNSWPHPLA